MAETRASARRVSLSPGDTPTDRPRRLTSPVVARRSSPRLQRSIAAASSPGALSATSAHTPMRTQTQTPEHQPERLSPPRTRSRTPVRNEPPVGTLRRTPEHHHVRSAPYPARAARSPARSVSPVRRRRSDEQPNQGEAAASPARSNSSAPIYQLCVRPIVKKTTREQDASGRELADFVVNGSSFGEIIGIIWEKYESCVDGRAVKTDGVWTKEAKSASEWDRVMQLRDNRHSPRYQTEDGWRRWLVRTRGETIKLLIFQYGLAIVKGSDYNEFCTACITPAIVDRAGATAEELLQRTMSKIQDRWGSTFRAVDCVWRMWGNHITRNLDQSTWDDLIQLPPPAQVTRLLRPAHSTVERQLQSVNRSANTAMECINSGLADLQRLREHWQAFGDQLSLVEDSFESRKRIVQALSTDAALPPLDSVHDPLPQMENVPDTEHDA